MKRILLVISLISTLILVSCTKNEDADNVNIPENIDNSQQEVIKNAQENKSGELLNSKALASEIDDSKDRVYNG